MRRLFALVVLLAAVVAGCGGGFSDPGKPVPVALDFTPNPVHAPIYLAGNALQIRKPGTGPDSLKLVSTGQVDLGVLYIHDLAIARQEGVDVVAVGALVSKPLAALIAQPQVKRPRDLA